MKGENKEIVGLIEKVRILGDRKGLETYALFDTGATHTSIDVSIAKNLGLIEKGKAFIKSKSNIGGGYVRRSITECRVEVKNKQFFVDRCNIANRENMSTLVLIGRDILFNNFIVDVEKTHKGIYPKQTKEKINLRDIKYFKI